MKCAKEELSPRLRARLNELFLMLRCRWWTKEELCLYFGTGERQIRDMISIVAKEAPVIATSKQRGYKIAAAIAETEGEANGT